MSLSADCSDCPPIDYPTDMTRCAECPRRQEARSALPVGGGGRGSARDGSDAHIEVSPASQHSAGWRAISSAPKDATALAVIEPTAANTVVAYQAKVLPVYFDEEGRVCDCGTWEPDPGIVAGYFRATRWMPLPPLPSEGDPAGVAHDLRESVTDLLELISAVCPAYEESTVCSNARIARAGTS